MLRRPPRVVLALVVVSGCVGVACWSGPDYSHFSLASAGCGSDDRCPPGEICTAGFLSFSGPSCNVAPVCTRDADCPDGGVCEHRSCGFGACGDADGPWASRKTCQAPFPPQDAGPDARADDAVLDADAGNSDVLDVGE